MALINIYKYIQYSASNIDIFFICVDSESVLYALQNWDYKIRRDIFHEAKYLKHCIMSRGIGIEFCWIPSHCGLCWNEISDELAKQGAMKSMSQIYNQPTTFVS